MRGNRKGQEARRHGAKHGRVVERGVFEAGRQIRRHGEHGQIVTKGVGPPNLGIREPRYRARADAARKPAVHPGRTQIQPQRATPPAESRGYYDLAHGELVGRGFKSQLPSLHTNHPGVALIRSGRGLRPQPGRNDDGGNQQKTVSHHGRGITMINSAIERIREGSSCRSASVGRAWGNGRRCAV